MLSLYGCLSSSSVFILCFVNGVAAMASLIVTVLLAVLLLRTEQLLARTALKDEALTRDYEALQARIAISTRSVLSSLEMRHVIIVLMAFNIMLFFICVLGFVSALKHQKICLVAYSILTMLILLFYTFFLVIVLNGREELASNKLIMKRTITRRYRGLFDPESRNGFFNAFMVFIGCCGVDDYRDFEHTKKWKKVLTVTLKNVTLSLRVDMPLACCKNDMAGKIVTILKSDNSSSVSGGGHQAFDLASQITAVLACASVNSNENNKDKGCYDAMWDMIEPYANSLYFKMFNFVLLACLIVAVVVALLSLCYNVFP